MSAGTQRACVVEQDRRPAYPREETFIVMRISYKLSGVITAGVALAAVASPTRQASIVVCSPGSPGTTDDAKPAMEAFAAAASSKAGTSISAIYEPSEEKGVARIKEASIAIVSLPFFVKHENELGLHPRLEVVQKGRPPLDTWTLVAPAGGGKDARSLSGFTIVSTVSFAPAFVRGVIRDLPVDAKLVQSTAVLSALRRAAGGEQVAVLLDGPQGAALATLPFASKLTVIAHSPALPAAIVATVDARLTDDAWRGIEAALLGLADDRSAAGTLDGIQIARLTRIDDHALAVARNAYVEGAR